MIGTLTTLCALWAASFAGPEAAALSGEYVEARTASVFAGACHFGGEYTTQGREAVLGWHFASGQLDGVSVADQSVAVLVRGDQNLAEPATARQSVVYLDRRSTPAQRAALLRWLKDEHGATIGKVREVIEATVRVETRDEGFEVSVGDRIQLRGTAMPDRACCKMPFQVWYEPFAPVTRPLVGQVELFSSAEPALESRFERRGENLAFFGRF